MQKARSYSIETHCAISPQIHTGLIYALDAVGGVDVLLYLAAKVTGEVADRDCSMKSLFGELEGWEYSLNLFVLNWKKFEA